MLANYLASGIALDALRAGVPIGYDTIEVQHIKRVIGHALNQQTELPLAFTQSLERRLSLGDVAGDFSKTQQIAVFAPDRIDDNRGPESSSILAHTPAFAFVATILESDLKNAHRQPGGAILLGIKTREVLSDDFVRGITLHPLCAHIPIRYNSTRLDHIDGVIDHALDQQAEATLAFEKLVLPSCAFGNVTNHFGEADQLARGIPHRLKHGQYPQASSILPGTPALIFRATKLRRFLEDPLRNAVGPVIWTEEAGEVLANDIAGGITGMLFGAGIPACDNAIRVQHVDRVIGKGINQQLHALLVAYRMGWRKLRLHLNSPLLCWILYFDVTGYNYLNKVGVEHRPDIANNDYCQYGFVHSNAGWNLKQASFRMRFANAKSHDFEMVESYTFSE